MIVIYKKTNLVANQLRNVCNHVNEDGAEST